MCSPLLSCTTSSACFVCFRCFPVAATYFHLQAIVQQIFPGLAHGITGLRPLPENSFAGVADPVCTSNRAVCYVEFPARSLQSFSHILLRRMSVGCCVRLPRARG